VVFYLDINLSNGNRFNTTNLSPAPKDYRALCWSPNGNFYGLTADGGANEQLIAATTNFGSIFSINCGHNPTYNMTPNYCNGPSPQIMGYNGIAANTSYIYTNSGSTLYKRDIANGKPDNYNTYSGRIK